MSAGNRYDLVVLGCGPAGEKGAAQAAYFGKRVAIVEKEPWLGGAGVNTGTVPSKTLRETALALSGWRSRKLFGVDLSLRRQATVAELKSREERAGFQRLETYDAFGEQVKETKRKLLEFLISAKREGKSIVGYGAPGKGNTLLNYCGIRTDFLDYTVDKNPYKHGKFLPGTHIPIFPPERIRETRPDYVLILPWNLKDEIVAQLSYIREWGARCVVPIPEVQVCP